MWHLYRPNVSMTEATDRIYNGLANRRSPRNLLAAASTITREIADIKRGESRR